MTPGSRPAPLRLALVGARRTRQGLGPWLARHLAHAGAEVVAVVGSRLATAREASDALACDLGHRPIPLAHADDLERLPELEALVVASPHETHEPWLRWAVGRGLHVLCEKPLVWGGAEAVTWAGALARRFEQRGLHLRVNAQHVHGLEAFRRLHPDVAFEDVTRLSVRMAPPSRGRAMLPDAVPHVLSLLYALAPDPRARLEGVSARWGDDEGRALSLSFGYRAAGRALAVEVELVEGGASPRELALALNGRTARREVDPATYAMRWADGPRSVPLPDPMAALCADFVERVRSGAAPRPDPSAVPGVAHLVEIAAAVPDPALTEIPFP